MNIPWTKAAKAAAGGLLLLVLLITINRWWGDYKDASDSVRAAAISSTVTTDTAGDKKSVKGDSKSADSKTKEDKKSADKYVIVVQDGLNFRYEPSILAKTHGGLKKGQKLLLIKTENGWYQVKDDNGVEGWVSGSPQHTKLQ